MYFSNMVHQDFQCPCGILTMVFSKQVDLQGGGGCGGFGAGQGLPLAQGF